MNWRSSPLPKIPQSITFYSLFYVDFSDHLQLHNKMGYLEYPGENMQDLKFILHLMWIF